MGHFFTWQIKHKTLVIAFYFSLLTTSTIGDSKAEVFPRRLIDQGRVLLLHSTHNSVFILHKGPLILSAIKVQRLDWQVTHLRQNLFFWQCSLIIYWRCSWASLNAETPSVALNLKFRTASPVINRVDHSDSEPCSISQCLKWGLGVCDEGQHTTLAWTLADMVSVTSIFTVSVAPMSSF